MALLLLGFAVVMGVFLYSPFVVWAADNSDDLVKQKQAKLEAYLKKNARLSDKYPHTVLYNVKKRRTVGLNRVFEFEPTPLDKRIPVVLVPGRAEEFQQSSWWKKIDKLIRKDAVFNQYFKLYVYVYDSTQAVEFQALDFSKEMKARFAHLPEVQQVVLVTYSMGGMISVQAMQEAEIFNRIHTMFALAVPFHGSPLFDPDWFTTYMRSPNYSPIRTIWDRLIYRGYLYNKPNLIQGLRWNNFDSSLPQFDRGTVHVKGDQIFHRDVGFKSKPMDEEIKKKTIVYASYLENGYTKSNQPFNPLKLPKYVLDKSAKLPKELVGTVFPAYGLSAHSVLTYMNYQLANIPTFTPEYPEGKNTNLYRFNDGAIPLSSMLWLPQRDTPYSDDFQGLIKAVDVQKVRVFVNLDHMHIGDYGLRKSRLITDDVVHPQEGKRAPNEWIVKDLFALIYEDSGLLRQER